MNFKQPSSDWWDVIIIGGGPAGLSAALLLGRCLRRVLLCDNGQPRNRQSHVLNGFLSRDGSSPQAFLQTARQELDRYATVQLLRVTVSWAEREDGHFVAALEDGGRIRARMVLIATGLVDELPDIEGMALFYGVAVHSCPFCHGWECRDKSVAVVGSSDETAELAVELTCWSKDILLCTQGREHYGSVMQSRLQSQNIRLEHRHVVRAESDASGNFMGLRLADGALLSCDAVFVSPRQHQHSELARSLGCRLSKEDGCIECGDDFQTCVPGVFTAGNASQGIQLAIMAAAEGTRAAVAIHEALMEADTG